MRGLARRKIGTETGYPRPGVTHHFRAQPWGPSRSKARRRPEFFNLGWLTSPVPLYVKVDLWVGLIGSVLAGPGSDLSKESTW